MLPQLTFSWEIFIRERELSTPANQAAQKWPTQVPLLGTLQDQRHWRTDFLGAAEPRSCYALSQLLLHLRSSHRKRPTPPKTSRANTTQHNPFNQSPPPNMSFLGFGQKQPSSAEKIGAIEAEMKLMADMMNR